MPHENRVLSAHRTPELACAFASEAESRGLEVIIAGAGGAAHLAGVTAAYTTLPVLGVPMESKALHGMDSLLSTVQMPPGIPVGTLAIGAPGAKNAALLAIAILANHRPELRAKLHQFRAEQKEKIAKETLPKKDVPLETSLPKKGQSACFLVSARIPARYAHSYVMPRMPRAVLPEVPHHLTQRGVDRRPIFFADSDRRVYLDLVRSGADRFGVSILGYCMMPNHVHWIVVPARPDSLAKAFGQAHCRYAHYTNAVLNRCGHFWQNRFFSCALDRAHRWAALRYVERNPVRAGLATTAEAWPWSSAAAHIGEPSPEWLNLDAWRAAFTQREWRFYLASSTLTEADLLLRINTYSGRPLGSAAFVDKLEAELGRHLTQRKGGGRARRQRASKGFYLDKAETRKHADCPLM